MPGNASEPRVSRDLWIARDGSPKTGTKIHTIHTSELRTSQDLWGSRDQSPTKQVYTVEEYERVLRSLSEADPGLDIPETAAELAAVAKAERNKAPNG